MGEYIGLTIGLAGTSPSSYSRFILFRSDRLHRFAQKHAQRPPEPPNFLPSTTFGEAQGAPYIVSELLEAKPAGGSGTERYPTTAVDCALQVTRGGSGTRRIVTAT